MKKGSFTFKNTWYEVIKGLPQETQFEVYSAIMEYGCCGNILTVTALAEGVFALIKSEIDAENERKLMLSEIRRNAGKKGGAPKGNNNAQRYENKQLVVSKVAKNKQNKQMVVFETQEAENQSCKSVKSQKQAKQANGCFGEGKNIKQAIGCFENADTQKDTKENKQMVVLVESSENKKLKEEKEKKIENIPPIPPIKEKEKNKEENVYIRACAHTHEAEPHLKEKNGVKAYPTPQPPSPDADPNYIKFNVWLEKNAPYIYTHFEKLITEKQFLKLKDSYSTGEIVEAISKIENRKDKRKLYCDLYRTVLNWIKPLNK